MSYLKYSCINCHKQRYGHTPNITVKGLANCQHCGKFTAGYSCSMDTKIKPEKK